MREKNALETEQIESFLISGLWALENVVPFLEESFPTDNMYRLSASRAQEGGTVYPVSHIPQTLALPLSKCVPLVKSLNHFPLISRLM